MINIPSSSGKMITSILLIFLKYNVYSVCIHVAVLKCFHHWIFVSSISKAFFSRIICTLLQTKDEFVLENEIHRTDSEDQDICLESLVEEFDEVIRIFLFLLGFFAFFFIVFLFFSSTFTSSESSSSYFFLLHRHCLFTYLSSFYFFSLFPFLL